MRSLKKFNYDPSPLCGRVICQYRVKICRPLIPWHIRCVLFGINVQRSHKLVGERKMELRDIMTRDVEVVSGEASLKDAAVKMRNLDVGLIPVCDGNRLQGMLTDRDITIRATAEGRDPNATKVTEVMSTDVAYCLEDQEIEEAVSLMEARQIRRLPIVNQEKQLVGIVSLGDIAVQVGDLDLAGETLKEISEPAQPKR